MSGGRDEERRGRGDHGPTCTDGSPPEDPHAGTAAAPVPTARPPATDRRSRGSLQGKLVTAEDWDSPEVNDEVARPFLTSD